MGVSWCRNRGHKELHCVESVLLNVTEFIMPGTPDALERLVAGGIFRMDVPTCRQRARWLGRVKPLRYIDCSVVVIRAKEAHSPTRELLQHATARPQVHWEVGRLAQPHFGSSVRPAPSTSNFSLLRDDVAFDADSTTTKNNNAEAIRLERVFLI